MVKAKTTMQVTMTLKERAARGSRPVKRLRQEGFIPGVVYGKGTEPLPVAVSHHELMQALHTKAGEHALVGLRLAERASWEKAALIKEIQHDPVKGHIVHVDFHAVALTERLRVKVAVALKGEPVGVKQEGGVLEHFLREVEVECLPTDIPAQIAFDASALKIGDTLHVRELTAPANTKITSDPEGVIASVQKPKEEQPEEIAAAVTEPEVIREKKEEEGEAAGARPGEGRAGEAAKPEAARPGAGAPKQEKEKPENGHCNTFQILLFFLEDFVPGCKNQGRQKKEAETKERFHFEAELSDWRNNRAFI